MVASNASNESRRTYRTKCRTKMAEHIWNKLGIVVKPEDIRLITTADDLYTWRVVPGKEHLFRRDILKKHMSQHSIGAYRHLFNAIGQSLEAVASQSELFEELIPSPQFYSEDGPDFDATVDDQEAEMTRQEAESNDLRNEIKEIRAVNDANEKRTLQLKTRLEKAEREKAMMLQSIQEFKVMVDFWKTAMLKSAEDCLVKLNTETCGAILDESQDKQADIPLHSNQFEARG